LIDQCVFQGKEKDKEVKEKENIFADISPGKRPHAAPHVEDNVMLHL
jgi:hypothetical protein